MAGLSRLIAFDVDSTLLRVESLDTAIEAALADIPDSDAARQRLHEITDAGMTGRMALRESLEARLALAGLNRPAITEMAQALRRQITPGFKPLLKRLRGEGEQLHAISGGFVDLIQPALEDLGFGDDQIHANRFVYDGDRVTGLDAEIPLSRNGGKSEILHRISGGETPTIMVGDGMTDFEAFEEGAASRFIGFGLIRQREVVVAAAEWAGADYVRSVDALASALRR